MIVYDAGVLIAADRGEPAVRARHAALLDRGVVPRVPAAVLAQAWRGGPQPGLSRLLRGCEIVPLDEAAARRAGALCAGAGTGDVVDASVVVAATGGVAVTTDPDDLRRLAEVDGGVEVMALDG